MWTIVVLFLICLCLETKAQNLALGRPTWYNTYGTTENNSTAPLAVDGDESTYTIAQYPSGLWYPAWLVKLDDNYYIQNVTVIAPPESTGYGYLESFNINVVEKNATSTTTRFCASYNATGNTRYTRISLSCGGYAKGDVVTIFPFMEQRSHTLAMAEVIINGVLFSGNQALGKLTRQIGTNNSTNGNVSYPSWNAVDSNVSTCALAESEYSDTKNSPAWWQVDLVNLFNINAVKVELTNEENILQYYKNITVTVANESRTDISDTQAICTLNYTFVPVTTYPNSTAYIYHSCYPPIIGRYVTIRRLGGYQATKLGLCDVKVMGEYYGKPDQTPASTTLSNAVTTTTTIKTNTTTSAATTTTTTTVRRDSTLTTLKSTQTVPTSGATKITTTVPTSQTEPQNGGKGLGSGSIAAIVLGAILGLLLVSLLIWALLFCSRNSQPFGAQGKPADVQYANVISRRVATPQPVLSNGGYGPTYPPGSGIRYY